MGQEESDQNFVPFLSKKSLYKISAQFVEKWLPLAKLQFGLRSELDNKFRGPNRPHPTEKRLQNSFLKLICVLSIFEGHGDKFWVKNPYHFIPVSGLTQSSSSNMSEVFYPPTTRSVVLFDGGFLCNICIVSHSPSNQDYNFIKNRLCN